MAYLRNDRLQHMQRLLRERHFSDRAYFSPRDDQGVVNEWGIVETVVQSRRSYEGSIEIPCLFYSSRAFENEELDVQNTVANRMYLEVPKDFVFDETDYITDVNTLRRFEIRKVSGVGRLDFSNELQLTEIMSDYDNEASVVTGVGFSSGFSGGFAT